MEHTIYFFTVGCFVLYFMGSIKRQILLHKGIITFTFWHAIFTVSTIPVTMALIYQLLDDTKPLSYTLWVPVLCFHICNVVDLNSKILVKE